jgi:hypothetical protein
MTRERFELRTLDNEATAISNDVKLLHNHFTISARRLKKNDIRHKQSRQNHPKETVRGKSFQ